MTNYIWTVALDSRVPDVTTQRRNRHWMVVHAPDKESVKMISREAVRRVAGIELRDEDFIAIRGGVRRA